MSMAAHVLMPPAPEETLAGRRDIARYLRLRDARADDDLVLAGLLVRTFTETYAEKLPDVSTDARRVLELTGVAKRRESGVVRVLDFGFRVIGTYALARPGTAENQAWRAGAVSLRCLAIDPEFHGLRFSTILLQDADAIARHWGCTQICLQVQGGAEGVARTYQTFGYERDPAGDALGASGVLEGYTLSLKGEGVHGR